MIRYMLFVGLVLATATSAIAAIAPAKQLLMEPGKNMTVINKNEAFPTVGPITVEPCKIEDCSDT